MMSMGGNTRIMIYQGHHLAMKLYPGMNGDFCILEELQSKPTIYDDVW
jgi:hypothetical protein